MNVSSPKAHVKGSVLIVPQIGLERTGGIGEMKAETKRDIYMILWGYTGSIILTVFHFYGKIKLLKIPALIVISVFLIHCYNVYKTERYINN